MSHSAPIRLLPTAARSDRPAIPVEHRRDRGLVLDCLRVRDLGGPWLDHSLFGLVEDRDATTSALVRDGLAAWGDLGIHITPRGRREWADQRNALRDLSLGIEAAT